MDFKSFLQNSENQLKYSTIQKNINKNKLDETNKQDNLNEIIKEDKAVIMPNAIQHIESFEKPKVVVDSKCFLFDSRHRDRIRYPNTNNYGISFNPDPSATGAIIRNPSRNITKINIDNVILPSVALNYPYIKLKIDELNNESISVTDGLSNDIYAILIPNKTVTASSFINCLIQTGCQHLPSTISSLKKLTISFYDPNGVLINFGADNINSIKDSVQTAVLATVEYLVSDRMGFTKELF